MAGSPLVGASTTVWGGPPPTADRRRPVAPPWAAYSLARGGATYCSTGTSEPAPMGSTTREIRGRSIATGPRRARSCSSMGSRTTCHSPLAKGMSGAAETSSMRSRSPCCRSSSARWWQNGLLPGRPSSGSEVAVHPARHAHLGTLAGVVRVARDGYRHAVTTRDTRSLEHLALDGDTKHTLGARGRAAKGRTGNRHAHGPMADRLGDGRRHFDERPRRIGWLVAGHQHGLELVHGHANVAPQANTANVLVRHLHARWTLVAKHRSNGFQIPCFRAFRRSWRRFGLLGWRP